MTAIATSPTEFTVHIPRAPKLWRAVDRRYLYGFDASRLYLDCDIDTARVIARQVGADRLQRNGWPRVAARDGQRIAIPYLACERCRNTGTYRWGPCINGRPPVHSASCFQCEGKGYQDDADQRRNFGYFNHLCRKAFAAV